MSKYFKWLTRPSSVARDEPYVRYLLDKGLKEFISVPIDEKIADYYAEKDSLYQMLDNLYKQILKNWQKHLQEYPKNKENSPTNNPTIIQTGLGISAIIDLFYN